MICEMLLAIGLGAGCVEPPPARDQAAEVLVDQEAQRKAEFDDAMARRARLYGGLSKCRDCGELDIVPFKPVK